MKSLIKRRAFVVNGTLGVLLIGGVGFAYVSLGDDGGGGTATASRTVTVSRGSLTSSVSASGAVQSAKSRSLSFTGSGTVDKIYVKVGAKVVKGQKLGRLDQTEALENLTAAKAGYTVASDADTSTAQGYSQYVQAKNTYLSAQRALDGTILYAPYAGTITAINGTVGGSAGSSSGSSASGTTSTGFMEIADTSKLMVEGSFTEADTTKLKVGQAATISFDALTGVTATGKVTEIGTTATTTSNVVSYTATISLTSRPAKVRIGQTATAVVTVAKASNALYVPTAAVTTAGGQSTVTVVKNGKPVVTVVTLGIAGDSGTEIKTGLAEGDTVQIAVAKTSGSSTQTQFGGGGGFGGAGGGTGGGAPPAGGGR
jgi:macrolide-specific efflux system membrane fusion protein